MFYAAKLRFYFELNKYLNIKKAKTRRNGTGVNINCGKWPIYIHFAVLVNALMTGDEGDICDRWKSTFGRHPRSLFNHSVHETASRLGWMLDGLSVFAGVSCCGAETGAVLFFRQSGQRPKIINNCMNRVSCIPKTDAGRMSNVAVKRRLRKCRWR